MIKYFWLLLSLGCIGWYLVVLGYVAYYGAKDIRDMLKSMGINKDGSHPIKLVKRE